MTRFAARCLGVVPAVLAVVASLAIMAQPGRAAMCFDMWTDPARPVQQVPTKVVAKEQWAVLSGDNFDLVARRDGMADISIRLSREAAGSLTWIGQVVFPAPGEWKLRAAVAVPENHYPCFEKGVSVVATSAEQSQTSDILPGAATIAAALGLVAVTVALAIRARHGAAFRHTPDRQ